MGKREPFACVPRRLYADPDQRVSPRALQVFAALTEWVDLPDGCRPSQQTIADRVGASRDTVTRALTELETVGAIIVTRRSDDFGRPLPSRYSLAEDATYRAGGGGGKSAEGGGKSAPTPGGKSAPTRGGKSAAGVETKENETKPHPPSLTTSAADATDAPKAEETLVYDDRSGDVRPVGEVADELCGLLADWIESHGAAPPFDRAGRPPRRWRDAVRLMLTKDGRSGEPLDEPLPQGSAARSPRRVAAAIEWAQRDDFWCANVLSPVKLRSQYDRLRLQARRRASQPGTAEHQAAQQSRREQQAAALRAQGR